MSDLQVYLLAFGAFIIVGVLVANRELLDEELFVDHQYAVSFTAANSGKYP